MNEKLKGISTFWKSLFSKMIVRDNKNRANLQELLDFLDENADLEPPKKN